MPERDKLLYDEKGRLMRPQSSFRSHISTEPGAEFPPERGRYHLYVAYACPWAHRTLIVRKLKGLEDVIPFTSVHHKLDLATGWRFVTPDEEFPGEGMHPDPVHEDVKEMRDLYFKHNPGYSGRYTVPVLWDKKSSRIVNNESSEIIRMFYTAFDSLLPDQFRSVDLYPTPLRSKIDDTNIWMYDNINNGVYKCGLAQTQEAYDAAITALFECLDRAEAHLAANPSEFYFGDKVTEVDIRLYVTIVRFDPVYVRLFKCNIRDIRSGYPAIHKWLRKLYWDEEEFRSTTDFDQIKDHYMQSLTMVNPLGIVAKGPLPHILGKEEAVPAVTSSLK